MKQCQEFICTRNAKIEKSGRFYCSDYCAQIDQRQLESGTKSVKMEPFSSEARGALSVLCSAEEKQIESATKESDHKSEQENAPITTKMLNDLGRMHVKNSDENTTEMLSPPEDETTSKSLNVIRRVPSVEPPVTSEMAASESMSLIDDSVKHLHGLMKSVGSHLQEKAVANERNTFVDPALVNSACNCAKQISQLLKVKLEMKKFSA